MLETPHIERLVFAVLFIYKFGVVEKTCFILKNRIFTPNMHCLCNIDCCILVQPLTKGVEGCLQTCNGTLMCRLTIKLSPLT